MKPDYTLKSIVSASTIDGSTESYITSTCSAADNGSNIYLNYHFPYVNTYGTFKTSSEIADFASTWADWDNDPGSDGNTIMVNNLVTSGDSLYMLQLLNQLERQEPPEWIFHTSGGMRLYIAAPLSL
jgi:hypothetical protein